MTEFRTRISQIKSGAVNMTLPKSYVDRRFDIDYTEGKLILLPVTSGGVKVWGVVNTSYGTLTFSPSKHGASIPHKTFKATCKTQGSYLEVGMTASDVEVIKPFTATQKPKPVVTKTVSAAVTPLCNDKASQCLSYINRFAQEQGYTIELYDNKLALSRTTRITGV